MSDLPELVAQETTSLRASFAKQSRMSDLQGLIAQETTSLRTPFAKQSQMSDLQGLIAQETTSLRAPLAKQSQMSDLQGLIAQETARLTCDYALYFRRDGQEPIFRHTGDLFPSASIIKIPILFAWAILERAGEVDRAEICDLDAEPPVQGAGLSWLLRARRLPFADVLLLMIALSDNLCTNLVIRRVGIARLNRVFREQLGLLNGTRLERKLMDYAARSRGLDNWVSARDAVQLFAARRSLTPAERAWIDPLFEACTDGGLWLRNVPRDTVLLRHKTGSIEGVLHDWGYTEDAELFILTRHVRDESEVYRALDVLGPALLSA